MTESLWNRNLAEWIHGALWLLSAVVFWQLTFGSFDARLAFLLFGICAVTFLFRLRALFSMYPMFVFGLICSKVFFSRPIMTGTEKTLLGLATLITIALGSRLQTLVVPEHQKVVTQRVAYAPTKLQSQRTQNIAGYLLSLLAIAAAWFVAGYLNSEFSWATENSANFQQYRTALRSGIRLVPWAFNGIRLTIYFATMFAIVHGVLSYLRCRNNDGQMGAMLLRHELWKWNRWEQKAVAKAARKNS